MSYFYRCHSIKATQCLSVGEIYHGGITFFTAFYANKL